MSDIERLGKYEILGTLGQGSFGVVYRGRDPYLAQDVAIKVCTLQDEDLRRRFFREAEISNRLSHPNIVGVHAFAFESGMPYLVQEYLEGEDLRDVIRRRAPWTADRKLSALADVAQGLQYAHEQGVVHRDIKPGNIRVLSNGQVKIMDFGIAKLANDESRLTQKGVTLGTASYLPPEQVRGSDVDFRADIFSFGVLAYELLAFERPFRGKTISALVYQILYKAPTTLAEIWPACPRELSNLVGRCLEKEAADRWPDTGSLLAEIRQIQARVKAGEWPALLGTEPVGPVKVDGTPEEASASSSEILSQSMISRTARDVSAQGTGTMPVTPGSGSGSGAAAATDIRATRRLDPSELPGQGAQEGGAQEGTVTAPIDLSEIPTQPLRSQSLQTQAMPAQATAAQDLRQQVPAGEGSEEATLVLPGADGATTQVLGPSELEQMARAPAENRGADLAATQRIAPGGLPMPGAPPPATPSADSVPAEAPPAASPSAVPPSAVPPASAAEEAEEPELATSAHQISQLVAQGELEAAMNQLEETMHRTRPAEAPAPHDGQNPVSVAPMPVDGDLPTLPIPREVIQAATDRAAAYAPDAGEGSEDATLVPTAGPGPAGVGAAGGAGVGSEDPTMAGARPADGHPTSIHPAGMDGSEDATLVPSGGPPPLPPVPGGAAPVNAFSSAGSVPPTDSALGDDDFPPTAPIDQAAIAGAHGRAEAPARTPTPSRPASAPTGGGIGEILRRPPVIVGAAVGAVILLVIVLLVLGGAEEEPPPPAPEPVVVEPPPVIDEAAVAADIGYLTVNAAPWGRVLAITDAVGERQALPAEATTPLRLELPAGVYRVVLIAGDTPPPNLDQLLEAILGTGGEDQEGEGSEEGEAGAGGTDTEAEAVADDAGDEVELEGLELLGTELCTVTTGESLVCNVVLEEASARQLFLDSGWWR